MTELCALEQALGRSEWCPESGCPFWEPGGAVLPGRCAFEQLDLSGRQEAAVELLRIRAVLDVPAPPAADREARRLLHRLLNESAE